MQCPECHKFPAFDLQEPEVDGVDVEVSDGQASVTAQARLVRTCTEDGTELKEANFEMEKSIEIPEAHRGEGHDISAQETSSESTERLDGKPGTPARYRKSYFGVKVEVEVSCSCKGWSETVTLEDEVAASGMDEIG